MRAFPLTAILLATTALSGCARHGINLFPFDQEREQSKIDLPALPTPILVEEGLASFYSDKFAKRKTASGKPYLPHLFTAAHPSAPFGTVLLVTNKENGKSVEVVVTDRGPFTKGRVIDLSRAAAQSIGIIRAGIAPVAVNLQPKIVTPTTSTNPEPSKG